jgi:hypothetical protein
MTTLMLVCGYIVCVFIGLLGLLILWKIFTGDIDLSDLIGEANGGASMSRFQLLIFTFVIALSLFLVIVSADGHPQFPATIPSGILTLLGISGSSYLVSKGIQFSDPAGITDRGSDVVISPIKANAGPGKTVQFSADVPAKPGSPVKWEVIAGPGTIDANGLYTADAQQVAALLGPANAAGAPAPHVHATIQVTSIEFPGASDLAVVTIS